MDVRQSFLGLLACTMLIAPQTPLTPDLADTLFQERLASYVNLRDEFSRFAHLPLEPTDERTMTAHRTRVGAALRIARADVPQGNIFSGVVATAFRRITAVAMESADIHEWVDRARVLGWRRARALVSMDRYRSAPSTTCSRRSCGHCRRCRRALLTECCTTIC